MANNTPPSYRAYARRIVATWPSPTPEQREAVRSIVGPIVNRLAATKQPAPA